MSITSLFENFVNKSLLVLYKDTLFEVMLFDLLLLVAFYCHQEVEVSYFLEEISHGCRGFQVQDNAKYDIVSLAHNASF